MDLLSPADLEGMRATAAEALDTTAVIQTQQFASDGGGGGTTSWVAAGTVACRIAPITAGFSGESVGGDRLNTETEVMVTFPAETSIDHNAQIVSGGGTFAVTAVRERSQEMTRRVEAKVIE